MSNEYPNTAALIKLCYKRAVKLHEESKECDFESALSSLMGDMTPNEIETAVKLLMEVEIKQQDDNI